MLGGGEAHLLQGVAGGFEGVDLGGGELVDGRLVPVGGAVFESVEGEACGLDGLLPVLAGGEGDALHYSPGYSPAPPWPPPSPPLAWLPPSRREGAAESAAGGVAGSRRRVWGRVGCRRRPVVPTLVASPSAVVVAVAGMGEEDIVVTLLLVGQVFAEAVGY